MLGRQVTVALRRPLQARLRTQTRPSLCIRTFTQAPALLLPAGKPKKTVGEPSKPVKRAVKTAAKKKTNPEAAAKKLAAKQKAAEKKKAQLAKKKVKRTLTPKQVEKKKAALARAQLQDLRKAALDPPKVSPASAWTAFMTEKAGLKSAFANRSQGAKMNEVLGGYVKSLAAEWRNCSPSEIEHYNHLAHTKKEAQEAAYKRWVESHTVDEIDVANAARASLRRKDTAKRPVQKWPLIKDERAVKRPMSAFVYFFMSRQASGDFKNLAVTDRTRLAGQEYKALSEDEKEKYVDLQRKDHERWVSEYTSVYGHAPPPPRRSASPA